MWIRKNLLLGTIIDAFLKKISLTMEISAKIKVINFQWPDINFQVKRNHMQRRAVVISIKNQKAMFENNDFKWPQICINVKILWEVVSKRFKESKGQIGIYKWNKFWAIGWKFNTQPIFSDPFSDGEENSMS